MAFFFAIAIFPAFGKAQIVSRDSSLEVIPAKQIKPRNNRLFLEAAGGSIYYSIGYERIINIDKKRNINKLAFQLEAAYFGIKSMTPSDMNINLSVGHIYGKKHCLESELGLILRFQLDPYPSSIAEQIRNKINSDPYRPTISSFYSIGIGYRYEGLSRFGFRFKPMYIFKYDFDIKYLSFQLPFFDTAIYFKF